MDVTTLASLIGTLGFPIFMCILMYKSNEDEKKRHQEEVNAITKAIENNTIVLTKLCERMGCDVDDE